MVLYIDKENVQFFMKSKGHPNFSKCEGLIRGNMDIHYNFPKEDITNDELLTLWFRQYGDGVSGKTVFCPPQVITPDRPLKSNFHSSLNGMALSSVYLLNDTRVCDMIADKSCILIGKVGEEISVIERLIIDGTETMTSRIDWNTYCPSLPVTDIIISDNHYFKDSRVYAVNNNELLRKIAANANISPVNVVIIVKEGETDGEIDIAEEQKIIKQMIRDVTQSAKSTVTILTTYKTHDRNLVTNYFRIKNGSCFHLKQSSLKNDVTTELKSHAFRTNMNISRSLLDVFQEIAASPVRCYGDRKSNYLNFD